ncbi:molybdopterin molybdotransferase MoeA [Streptomyces sp. NPDC001834]|uniref:molybdopterin molybdotransferase MoeA n=1 Tax=Streptomyces sp. NPDC001834 TaxID=3364616 RepID=UPI0036BD2C1D
MTSESGTSAEDVRAAEEDLAVEQALALVRSQSSGEPGSAGRRSSLDQSPDACRTVSAGQGRAAGRPGPASEHVDAVRSSTSTSASATDQRADRISDPDQRADRPHGGNRRGRSTSWREARALAARSGRSAPVRVRSLPLDQALGHVLAEPLVALTDLPPFDTSAMDGWVVSGPGPWTVREAAECGEDLEGAGEAGTAASPASGPGPAPGAKSRPGRDRGILAGHRAPARLPDGDAVRIATGARIPRDANAVIRSEHGRVDEAKGLLHAPYRVHPGQDIRPRGQECRSGDLLLPAGAVVTPAVLGLAAAAGYDGLATVPRPRVDVLVLGDELLTSGLPHGGLIRDALGPMIGPWLRALGAVVSAPQRLGDDAAALRRALISSGADLIVTTGGTAAGPVDHLHPVLSELGAELLVDGVAVRPGHPMLLARLKAAGPKAAKPKAAGSGGTGSGAEGLKGPERLDTGPYVVGLPGNPLAAVSGLLTLAEPLLHGLAGHVPYEPYWAVVRDEMPGHPHDTRLVPVVHRVSAPRHETGGRGTRSRGVDRPVGGAGTGGVAEFVAPLRYDGPAMLRGVAAADGLAVVPPGGVRSGTEVEILELPWASATPWTEGCFT